MYVCTYVMYLNSQNNILPVCQFQINVENMLKLKVVDKYWRSECKWVQQISVEIFDENICSEAQEI